MAKSSKTAKASAAPKAPIENVQTIPAQPAPPPEAAKPKDEPEARREIEPTPQPPVPEVIVGDMVMFRTERPHNGTHDAVAIVTRLVGDDAHGNPLLNLRVIPDMGEPFNVGGVPYGARDGERVWYV